MLLAYSMANVRCKNGKGSLANKTQHIIRRMMGKRIINDVIM
jgi:hypothetical protein